MIDDFSGDGSDVGKLGTYAQVDAKKTATPPKRQRRGGSKKSATLTSLERTHPSISQLCSPGPNAITDWGQSVLFAEQDQLPYAADLCGFAS